MTALEAFNALDNREVSRKEVEQVLLQAKAENNTTIIYRLSKILNDYPQATHFEISVTHYQPQEGLLGVQHTGNYKEALDDCGRLRKGWKFINGNVVKVEKKKKLKKESKPKKETDKTAIDDIRKIVQERLKNQGKPRLYEVLHLESAKGIFIFSWSDLGNIDGTKKKENSLAKGLYQYTFPKFKNTQEKIKFSNQVWYDLLINKSLTLKRKIEEPTLNIINLYLGKNTIEDIESISKKTTKEAKPKKEAQPKKEKVPQKETKKDKKYNFVVVTDNRPNRVIAVFSYTNPNIKDLRESFWKNGEGKYYETTEEGLRNYTFGMGPYPFADAKKNIEEKYTEGKDFIYFIIEKDGGRDEAISLVEKPKKEAQPKNNKEENPKKLKFSDVEVNKRLIEFFTNNSTGENLLFKKDVFGYIFSFSSLEKFMDIEQIYVLYGKDRKKEAEKDFSMMKEEISWTIEHHIKTAKREGTLEVCKKYFLEHLPELLAKGGLWLEAKAKNKGVTAARSIFTKLRKKVWKNIGELAVGKSVENVQDSSKKKVEIDSSKFKKAKVVQQIGDYVKNFFETGNCYVPKGIFPKKREGFKSSNLKGAFWLDDLEKEGLAPVKKNGEIFFVKTGLNAPRHEGILKEALTEKGKLKKGWYFQDYGIIDPKGKYHPLERDFAYEYKVASDELNSRAFEQNEKRKRKGFEENVKLQENLKGFLKSLSLKYKKYFKSYKAVEIFYWAFNFGERPTKFFTIDETNPYSEIQLKVFDKYFSNKNELFTRLENYETLRRYNLTDLGYNIISEIDSFLNKEGKKVRGDIKKINKKYGLNAPSVPEVSTEMFKHMSVPELREYTLEYYLENYGGKSISKNFFKEDNIQIEFFNTAGKKLQKPIYKEKVAVLEHLESLIKNSTYNNWGNRKESSPPNIIGYLNFKAKVTIDGEKRHVRISIAVDEKRKFRFKTLEVGANPKKKKQATSIPAPSVTESLRDSSLSEGKDTKKSLSRKKKDENFGLNAPEAPEAPETSLPATRQTLAQQLATRPEVRESFLVADEQMSLFLGSLEKKTKDSLVITLTGKQGSGKTRFAFQFMNALSQRYRVGHASIEEHPESVLYEEKAYQYLNDTALEHITAQDVRSLEELDTMIRSNEVIVIDSFQKMRELAPHFEIDKDLRKKYDGKLFLVIFQQTADGKMRGGSKSQFDGDIILFTETFPDYRENYVFPDKNRYNKRPATELQYSIYEKRMLASAPEDSSLPDPQEPTEIDELNFDVL